MCLPLRRSERSTPPHVVTVKRTAYTPLPTYAMSGESVAPAAVVSVALKRRGSDCRGSWWFTGSPSASRAVKESAASSAAVSGASAACHVTAWVCASTVSSTSSERTTRTAEETRKCTVSRYGAARSCRPRAERTRATGTSVAPARMARGSTSPRCAGRWSHGLSSEALSASHSTSRETSEPSIRSVALSEATALLGLVSATTTRCEMTVMSISRIGVMHPDGE
mmetsp:Transcript_96/g.167  ORF Transcript_96/g.167 Transcript_96/m.167 type:complete len:224 (-) Transcript_96:1884-2555(-)